MASEAGGRQAGIYYGWIVLGVCMAMLMVMVGTTINAFGLYVVPVSEAFGISRATMNTGMILMSAGSAVAALIVGRMLDRYPIRLIMLASIWLLAASLITFGVSQSVWLSAAMISFPVGFAMKGIGILTAPSLIARWFKVHRGKAMAILMMGMSLGPILVVPVIAWLIDYAGWRQSLVMIGVAVGIVMTLLLPFIRQDPGPDDHETRHRDELASDATAPAGAGTFTTMQVFAMPRFWAIASGTALTMAVFQGILVSLVPLAIDLGFTTTRAATLMSAMGIAAIAGKFTVALIADRFERPVILAVLFSLMAVACALLLRADSYILLVACSAIMGISSGASMPVFLALLADRFGALSMGTANGNATFVIAVLTAVSVRFAGEVFDRTGNYDLMFVSYIPVALFAAILIFLTRFSRPDAAPVVAAG